MPRELRSYRFDPAVVKAIGEAADATGLTQTEVIERILRRTLHLEPDPDALDSHLNALSGGTHNGT